MTPSLFTGTDWLALGWAALLAAITGWSQMRIRAREEGGKPAILADIAADTIIGTTAGLVLALVVPEQIPRLHTLGGITALACIGGVGGRRVYDLGLTALEWVAKLKLGIKTDDPPSKPKEENRDG